MFTEEDFKQIEQKGISREKIRKQVSCFENGFPFMKLVKPATINDGILRPDEAKVDEFVSFYEKALNNHSVVKFIPASGAATRMFKTLFGFVNDSKNTSIKTPEDFKTNGYELVYQFITEIDKFAFYEQLNEKLNAEGSSIAKAFEQKDYFKIINTLLSDNGLSYGVLPKGLLAFHSYAGKSRTPIEEHLAEGAAYANVNGKVNIHFTVSPEHRSGFEKLIAGVKDEYEKRFNVKYTVSYSVQKSSTDTIAVNTDNTPFRDNEGALFFRPGGHGALIENLNELQAEIVFIKNIDNVVPENLSKITYKYKKVIAGVLLYYQEKIHDYLRKLESTTVSNSIVDEIGGFLKEKLCVLPSDDFTSKNKDEKIVYLKEKLNRPIRVCGMVKNEGEPGGGPFWVENLNGTVGLQIIEGAQIDPDCQKSKEILKNATHFNPVDLVCSLKGFDETKFDLTNFIDNNSGFISKKSKDGRTLKALELPGLWNGAMSDWNTVFVEVRIETFNPVKTINDLLRPQHQ